MTLTRSFSSRQCRLALLSLAVLWLLGGCASTGDPRSNYRHDLWWLGAEPPNTARWPVNTTRELTPMVSEPIPSRTPPPATPSPDWPPL